MCWDACGSEGRAYDAPICGRPQASKSRLRAGKSSLLGRSSFRRCSRRRSRIWRNTKFAEFDPRLVLAVDAIADSENRCSLFCKSFRENTDCAKFAQQTLYAYLNLNLLNPPEVSKFR